MIRATCLIVMGGALLTAGCKRDNPAVYRHDVSVASTGNQLLPASSMRLTYNADLTKVRVGADPDLSDLKPPRRFSSADAEAIKAVPLDLIDLITENAWEDVPGYFVPDQAEQLDKFVPLVAPLAEKATAMNEAVTEKLGPPPEMPGAPGMPSLDPEEMLAQFKDALDGATVAGIDGENAVMTITMAAPEGAPPQMAGPQKLEVPFRLIDDQWFIEIPDFPAGQQIDTIVSMAESVVPSVTASLENLTAEVNDGTIADYPTLQQKTMMAFMPIMGQVMQMAQSMQAGDAPAETADTADDGDDGDK